MFKGRSPLVAAIVLALTPPLADAAEDPTIEDVLVTGSHVPQPALTASVSALDTPTIRAMNKRSVAELLQTMPGLLVEQQGGPGGLTAVSIRGGEANFTLVLLDGVQVNDSTNTRGGSYDFSSLNPALIQRIEVVRGALSAVYGSDALAGVVNIITRRNEAGHHQQLAGEIGEDDYNNQSLSAYGKLQTLNYGFNLSRRDDGELVEGSTRDTDSANMDLGWQPLDAHVLGLAYRYLDGHRTSYPEQSGGPRFALIDELDHSDYSDEALALTWQADFMANWRSLLSFSRFEHNEDYDSPGIYPFYEVPPNGANTDFRRDEVRWVNSLSFLDTYQLTLGADYREERGKSVGYLEFGSLLLPTDFKLNRDSTGLIAGISGHPMPQLLLQGSLRYDDPADFAGETSTRLGASYELNPALSASVNWGEGYKLPSFFALGHGLLGNPDLQPETSTGWDAGLGWQSTESLRVDATYFSNDFHDLIDFDPNNFTNVNRNEVRTSGVELQAAWSAHTELDLQAQATYTDIDVKDNASVLLGRPQWKAGVYARWQLSPNWLALLDYQWTGDQLASSLHTGETVVQSLDDFHRFDLALHWQVMPALNVELAVDNMFDEQYQTAVGFDNPGRVVRLGLRLHNTVN